MPTPIARFGPDVEPTTLKMGTLPAAAALAVPVQSVRVGAATDADAAGPVFVDSTGRRGRKLRLLGWVLGTVCAGFAVVLITALMSARSGAPSLLIPDPAPSATDRAPRQPPEVAATSALPTSSRPAATSSSLPAAPLPTATDVRPSTATPTRGASHSPSHRATSRASTSPRPKKTPSHAASSQSSIKPSATATDPAATGATPSTPASTSPTPSATASDAHDDAADPASLSQ